MLTSLNREMGEVKTSLGNVDKNLVAIEIRLDEGTEAFKTIEQNCAERMGTRLLLENRVKIIEDIQKRVPVGPFPWRKLFTTMGLIATAITVVVQLLIGG